MVHLNSLKVMIIKDYLTKNFDLGERTGQKADAQQVAMDMRSARTLDSQRSFCRDDWLTKAQVQCFFSRLAYARRKQGYSGDNTSKDDTNQDEEDEERCKDLGLKHPIAFDVCNLCQCFHDNKLSSFNVNTLKYMCRYFEIAFKCRDLKRDLLLEVSELVKECQCSKK